jgi:hypothetical protein
LWVAGSWARRQAHETLYGVPATAIEEEGGEEEEGRLID